MSASITRTGLALCASAALFGCFVPSTGKGRASSGGTTVGISASSTASASTQGGGTTSSTGSTSAGLSTGSFGGTLGTAGSSGGTSSGGGTSGTTGGSTLTDGGFRSVCGPNENAGLPPCCSETSTGGFGNMPGCDGILVSDGEVLQFKLTEYTDYAGTPTGNLVEFQFQLTLGAHFGQDAGTCLNVAWGYVVTNALDGGYQSFKSDGCDGKISDGGTWTAAGCGGESDLHKGFYDCDFGNMDDAEAMWGEIDVVGFWADMGQGRKYYDSSGQSDFRPLYFVVPR
jgi:hypothetical protein